MFYSNSQIPRFLFSLCRKRKTALVSTFVSVSFPVSPL